MKRRKLSLDDHIITPAEAEELLVSDDVCGLVPQSQEMAIGKVLLFSMWVGENADQLSAVSGIPLTLVAEIAAKLEGAKVFGAGINHRKEYMSDGGSIVLSCDIQCCMGVLRRAGEKDGSPAWIMTEEGLEHVERDLLIKPEAQEMLDDLSEAQGKPKSEWRKAIGKTNQEFFCPKCKLAGKVLLPRKTDLMSAVYAIALEHEKLSPSCDQIPTGLRARSPQCSDEEWAAVISGDERRK